MKKTLLLFLMVALTGCAIRTALYAPRRSASQEHQGATVNQDCLGCHDPSALRRHGIQDDCLRCHPICREC